MSDNEITVHSLSPKCEQKPDNGTISSEKSSMFSLHDEFTEDSVHNPIETNVPPVSTEPLNMSCAPSDDEKCTSSTDETFLNSKCENKSSNLTSNGLSSTVNDNNSSKRRIVVDAENESHDGNSSSISLGSSPPSKIPPNSLASSKSSSVTDSTSKRKSATNAVVTPAETDTNVSIPKKKKIASTPSTTIEQTASTSITTKSSLLAHISPPLSSSQRPSKPPAKTSPQQESKPNIKGGGPVNKQIPSSDNNHNKSQLLDVSSPKIATTRRDNGPVQAKKDSEPPSKASRSMAPPVQEKPPATEISRKLADRQLYEEFWNNMKDVCDTCKNDNKFMMTLNFERKPSNTGSGLSIDLYGTFLPKEFDEHKYDFFDEDEFGEIILKPSPPMFPGDFPGGFKEHPLSWWGVVDPEHGAGKFGHPKKQESSSSVAVSASKPSTGKVDQSERSKGNKARGGGGGGDRKEEQRRPMNNSGPPPPGWGRDHHGPPRGGNMYDGPPGRGPPPGWGPYPPGYNQRRNETPDQHYFWGNGQDRMPPPSYWNGPPPPHDGHYPHPPWNGYGRDGPHGSNSGAHRDGPPSSRERPHSASAGDSGRAPSGNSNSGGTNNSRRR